MNLIIDVGNTLVKIAIFKKDALLDKEEVKPYDFIKAYKKFKKQHKNFYKGIISSVGNLDTETLNYLKQQLDIIELDSKTKLPFINNYKTPKTLGVDRIALVSASVYHYPDNNVLIIDAGSCITYDFIDGKNEYHGGAISPGIRMRYNALNNLTANLPLLETEIPKSIIGNSTESSIHSGVIHGVLNEIDGVIANYRENYSDLTVILTGGDANFLSKQLKSSIFANSNFLLEGLNHILQFNSN
ncbi:MAG TPA: type III pantothenate kinase [Flavobacteriaceae bacterium]|nr:type III pantothenate kinase [Flavobacteriaceae bacterium]